MNKVLFVTAILLFIGSISAEEFSKKDENSSEYEQCIKDKKMFLQQQLHDINQEIHHINHSYISTVIFVALTVIGIAFLSAGAEKQCNQVVTSNDRNRAANALYCAGGVSIVAGIGFGVGTGLISSGKHTKLIAYHDKLTDEIIHLDSKLYKQSSSKQFKKNL